MTKIYPKVLMSPMFLSVRKKIRKKRFFSVSWGDCPLKAMDQPCHVTRFLFYRHFSLCNPISIKIKIGNWNFFWNCCFNNYKHLWPDRSIIVYFISFHKFSVTYPNFYRNINFCFNNYEHLWPGRSIIVYFISFHKFSVTYLNFYRNGVT